MTKLRKERKKKTQRTCIVPSKATVIEPIISYQALSTIATESWRLQKTLDRILGKLEEKDRTRFSRQTRWYFQTVQQILRDAQLRIINLEGQVFNPGMAASPLNLEDFDKEDELVVEQMLEPVIMKGNHILKTGSILLKKNINEAN